eukprot:2250566-Prymnesium_polylepis.1
MRPSASVRAVRVRPLRDGSVRTRARPSALSTLVGPSTRPWPARTVSHLTHIYSLQTKAHSSVLSVPYSALIYALVATAAYHVGSSDPNLNHPWRWGGGESATWTRKTTMGVTIRGQSVMLVRVMHPLYVCYLGRA